MNKKVKGYILIIIGLALTLTPAIYSILQLIYILWLFRAKTVISIIWVFVKIQLFTFYFLKFLKELLRYTKKKKQEKPHDYVEVNTTDQLKRTFKEYKKLKEGDNNQ